MKRAWLATAVLLTLAGVANGEDVRTVSRELSLEPGQRLVLEAPVGRVSVEGFDGDNVQIEMTLECSRNRRRCLDAAEEVTLESRSRGDRLIVELDGFPSFGNHGLAARVSARVPRTRAVEIDLGVGEVEVTGVRSHVRVDLGVGEARISLDEQEVASVRLETGIGEGSLYLSDGEVAGDRAFLSEEVLWSQGSGDARIEVDVGVGEARVRLR